MLMLTYVPVLCLWTWFCVWGCMNSFWIDRSQMRVINNGMVIVGQIMQYMILFFVIRDWLGVVKSITMGYPSVFVALAIKMQFCLLDQLLILVFAIWGLIAALSDSAQACAKSEIVGCADYVYTLKWNSIVSLIFLFANCCIFPCIFMFTLIKFAEREDRKKREREAMQDMDNALLVRGESYVAKHGEVSIFDALNTDFKELAKKEEDFSCCICLTEFQDDDAVTELKCFENHIFHSDCIVDWLKKNQTCPICRADVGKVK